MQLTCERAGDVGVRGGDVSSRARAHDHPDHEAVDGEGFQVLHVDQQAETGGHRLVKTSGSDSADHNTVKIHRVEELNSH